jgi:dihydrodipicolinate synthase/N-acetylneuraminate lyase
MRTDRNNSGASRNAYHGIVLPLVTPLLDRDILDRAGLERLIDHVLIGGVHGLFLLGTTGEASALSINLRREFVKAAVEQVNKKVPILVSVSDTSLVESLQLARDIAEFGADAIVVTTPYYIPLEERELVEYVRMLDKESPLPVVLYNMPRLTKQSFSLETLREAMQFKNVVGVKDSSGDMEYFKKLCDLAAERPDWSLLVGSESLLADAIKMGADGGVTGGANVAPNILVDVYHSATNGDHERVKELQQSLRELATIYKFGQYAAGTIRGLKCALDLMGICSDRMADPHHACDASQRKVVEQQLIKLELLRGERRTAASAGDAIVASQESSPSAGTAQYS